MKTAVIGCGGISRVHMQALSELDLSEPVAFVDIKPERAEKMAAEHGGRAYTDYKEMLDKEHPDIVHICTPHYLHVPMARECVARGINVLMEKPPAMTHKELDDFLAMPKNVQVGVCFQNRYNRNVQLVRKKLLSGEAGAVLGARAFVTWKRGEKYYTESGWRGTWETEGGGVLINQSIHTLDLLIYLLGQPKAVEGSVHNHHLKETIEVEDTAEAYIQFDGCTALFYATTANCTDSPVMIDIVCENMTFRLEGAQLTCIKDGKSEEIHFDEIEHEGKACYGEGHRALITDFYHCVLEGQPFPIGYAEDSHTLNLLLGFYESANTGAPGSL